VHSPVSTGLIKKILKDLFDGRRQLIVYHFMFDPAWDSGILIVPTVLVYERCWRQENVFVITCSPGLCAPT
jgi:uncharacterized protein DUF899